MTTHGEAKRYRFRMFDSTSNRNVSSPVSNLKISVCHQTVYLVSFRSLGLFFGVLQCETDSLDKVDIKS